MSENKSEKKYKVCTVTGTRAEYGLLSPVLAKIKESDKLRLQLIVTGAHLSAAYGATVKEIAGSGMPITAQVDILKFADTQLGVAETVGFATAVFAKQFAGLQPGAVLLLGDRYEIFAAATAAAILNIPIAHISGGDVTTGAQDEFFRHSISKMAKLHFASCEDSAKRLLRMGEEPARVYNVGGLGDENIRAVELFTRDELAQSLEFATLPPFLLVTFHPETAKGHAGAQAQMGELLAALNDFSDYTILFTKANADAGGTAVNNMIDRYCEEHKNAVAHTSLGLRRYLSAMKHCAAVVGNSSSGVVETPSFGKPAVNIGTRQAGRIMCANVLCTPAKKDDITASIKTALTPAFAKTATAVVSPYNGGNTSGKIVTTLEYWLSGGALAHAKNFYEGDI